MKKWNHRESSLQVWVPSPLLVWLLKHHFKLVWKGKVPSEIFLKIIQNLKPSSAKSEQLFLRNSTQITISKELETHVSSHYVMQLYKVPLKMLESIHIICQMLIEEDSVCSLPLMLKWWTTLSEKFRTLRIRLKENSWRCLSWSQLQSKWLSVFKVFAQLHHSHAQLV